MVKMQEAEGLQIARLFSTDLAKGEHCGRKDCHLCTIYVAEKTSEQTANRHLFYMNQNAGCTILKKNIHPSIRKILIP